jgi:mannan endo-1,4-beta-mannosidase
MNVGLQRAINGLRGAEIRVLLFASLVVPAAGPAADAQPMTSFVKTSGTASTVDGTPFFVTGVNNHYLTFGSKDEIIGVLDDAAAMGANVVRFLQPVIGSLDGKVATIWNRHNGADASNLGVGDAYLLCWDPHASEMAINDDPSGMENVDFLIAEAGKRHLKPIIAFLDFWAYTGGAQQMRAWYKSTDKTGFFFNDPRPRRDYRNWDSHVAQRVNRLTELAYGDDATVMAWEPMNEGNARPESLRLAWTPEMSAYVKSQDHNHLVGSGHANVDPKLSDLTIPTLDFGTWHGYPLYYNLTVREFNDAITEFCGLAGRADKPVLLDDFGYARSNRNSAEAYALRSISSLATRTVPTGFVWRLVSRQDSGRYPVDEHDQFDIRNDRNPIWHVLQDATAWRRADDQSNNASKNLRETP